MVFKLIRKLPVVLLVVLVLGALYYSKEVLAGAGALVGSAAAGGDESQWPTGPSVDLGMYDSYNPNAFGTTKEEDRRITNDGVRREFHHNPFPWAEDMCQNEGCDKHGIPEPGIGQTHICKNGFPSKRIVDMHGGHFQLNHICAPGGGGPCGEEPAVLGRWWCSRGCSNAESVGLDVRPICTRCK